MAKRMKLFCLSYAGGTAMVYTKWKMYLDNNIELCPLEMSGRGKRFGTHLFENVKDAVEDLFVILKKESNGSDYAFFGHSMGTLIIFELMKKIKQSNYREPLHIILSGRFPPHIKEKKIIHNIPDDLFKREIFELGGVPKELIENKEVLDVFMPVLRADYKLVETYKYRETYKWNFNISVFSGKDDSEVKDYDISEWRKYTNEKCDFYEFNGGHFFIHDHMTQVVQTINDILSKYYITDFEYAREVKQKAL